jgi:hypothetical protein
MSHFFRNIKITSIHSSIHSSIHPIHNIAMKASLLLSFLPLIFAADSKSKTPKVRRERNLDHLDADTLIYYLGVNATSFELLNDRAYVGFDVAVMFYAQYDEKSHRFAPYWDSIATYAKAGSKESNLLMGLFNCELDSTTKKLCKAIGVTKYPTMMFIGAGPYPDQALVGTSKDSTPLPHTVKFVGDWKYGDAVLDWVHCMQGISRWHQWGLIKSIRRGLLGFFMKSDKKDANRLPVGLPMATTGTGGGASAAQLSLLESKLKAKDDESKSYKQMATHASLLLDTILCPPAASDPFVLLSESKGWDNKVDPISVVLRGCTVELSLDYCSRLSSHVTNDWLDNVYNASAAYVNYTEIEQSLKDSLVKKEPYCAVFDDCLVDDFKKAECRPTQCPFQEEVACRYLTSCLEPTIQKEYAVALELIKEGESFPPKKAVTGGGTKPAAGAKKAKADTGAGGWFKN